MRRRRPETIKFHPAVVLDRQMIGARVIARSILAVQCCADVWYPAVSAWSSGRLVIVTIWELHCGFCVDWCVVRALYGCLPGSDCGKRRGGWARLSLGSWAVLSMLGCGHEDFDRFGTVGATCSISARGTTSGSCACHLTAKGVHASLLLECSHWADLEGECPTFEMRRYGRLSRDRRPGLIYERRV